MTKLTDHVISEAADDQELAVLIERLTARIQAGEIIDSVQIANDHPEHAERIRQLLPALKLLGGASNSPATWPHVNGTADAFHEPLGDFQIIREVGRGGMGVVYEATQLSLNRRVALKILPLAATMDARHLQRFKNEALAAASLEHPNIVPVYGVGCDRGVHYYAMKFIDGRPLTDIICPPSESSKPGQPNAETELAARVATVPMPRDRGRFRRIAEWGIQAAEALEHAHSFGIVHRDIKPGNLIVDAAGKLWVTDFGLARFGNDAGMTMTGDMIGTLRYMSPEQALAKHGLMDHRTDVNSLGATLYELLTGRPAVEGADKQEILKKIAFEEPVALRKIDKSIPVELETITLKCLAKEPNERYASAGEVAEDLRRWMGDQTIKAKPPGWREKASKWGRRHRSIVRAIAISLIVVLVGLAWSTWVVWRERQTKLLAEQAAAEQTLIAQQLEGFIHEDLFGQARFESAGAAGGTSLVNVTLIDALKRTAPRIDQRFHDRPLVAAAMHRAIGLSFSNSGEYGGAIKHVSRASEILAAHLGADDVYTLSVFHDLAFVRRSAGQFDEALCLGESVLAKRIAKLGPTHNDTLITAHNLARVYEDVGQWSDAVTLLEQTWASAKMNQSIEGWKRESIQNSLASAYRLSGRYADAIPILESMLDKNSQKDDSEYICQRVQHDLALAYKGMGHADKATQILEPLLPKVRNTSGQSHPNTLRVMSSLANGYSESNREDEAIRLMQEARQLCEQKLGDDHPELAAINAGFGLMLLKNQKWNEAEPILRDCVRIREKTMQDSWRTYSAKLLLGTSLLGQKRFSEAEPLLLDGYQGMQDRQTQIPPPAKQQLAESIERIIQLYDAAESTDKAANWRKSLKSTERPPD